MWGFRKIGLASQGHDAVHREETPALATAGAGHCSASSLL